MSQVSQPSLELVVNGESREFHGIASLADLVAELGLDVRTIAVEHGGSIVPRDRFDEAMLASGDRLEIVRFVQGG